ncbi:hypothetical protein NM688_g4258 [Phlebia brevispora]|uniref:Uncharacterized protein n=1 Tax=Phlebia brevispora TaxID=194682 RepID=A0ACC1T3K0_9APHY|nr:hypothetical protein NM688_g4258 [Phlebia brevispora]
MSASVLLFWTVLVLAVVQALRKHAHASRVRKLMPPGPPGIPVLGNALQVPKDQPFRQFAEWSKTYGPVFSLNLAGKNVVVLNSLKAARDLLDRRSAIYSDRPRLIMANEIMMGGKAIPLMPYGNEWRKHRRAVQDSLNVRQANMYSAIQEREAVNLVRYLLDDPENWSKHCERSIVTNSFSVVYGDILAGKDYNGIMEHIWHTAHAVSHFAGKERHLVDVFPVMLYIPAWLAKWRREGDRLFRQLSDMFEGFFGDVKRHINVGDDQLSFSARMIRAGDKYGLDSFDSGWLAGLTLMAGIDTSYGMLSAFMFAMLWHPDVMQRAQAELDTVVGRDRMPTLEDYDDLSYVRAIVREILRWWPVAPLGVPKNTMEDNWYQGYFIPKGTMILANLWAMGRDSAEFPDPENFHPERFLQKDGKPESKPQAPFAFGFGRRICPGMHLAMRTLFIDIACILWALNINPKLSGDGKPLRPEKSEAVDDGLTTVPVPFACSIRPRFSRVRRIVETTTNRTAL